MSNTPLTVNGRQAATMLAAIRGELEFNPFLDGDYEDDLRECEGMLRAALKRIRDNEERIAASRRPRVRQP